MTREDFQAHVRAIVALELAEVSDLGVLFEKEWNGAWPVKVSVAGRGAVRESFFATGDTRLVDAFVHRLIQKVRALLDL